VVLSITQVQEVLVFSEDMAQALGLMELCFIVASIDQAYPSVADLIFKLHCIFIDN